MIGSFVISKSGHDKGQYYVVIAQEGEYVFLCDGRLRTLEKPKKKKKKHIQPMNRKVNALLLAKLEAVTETRNWKENGIFDEAVKYEIKSLKHIEM